MAAEILPGIHPTRSDLLEIQRKLKLSKKGHKLLEEKRDALIMEFFERIKKLKGLRKELIDEMGAAYKALMKAESLIGPSTIDSLSRGAPESIELEIERGNVMGVKIPKFKVKNRGDDNRGFGSASLESANIDEAAAMWREAVKKLLVVVEAEEVLERLAEDIKRTKRRVNSLEYMTIPRINATRSYITSRLEEHERESFFRLKMVKKKSRAAQVV